MMKQAIQARTRVLIADDHPVVLSGMRNLLEGTVDMQLLGSCSDGRDTLTQIALALPDVAVIDVRMPGLDGLGVLAQARDRGLATRIVLLTASVSDAEIAEAVALGAYGLLLKDTLPDQLVRCIREVAAGHRWLPGDVASAIAREAARRQRAARLFGILTEREREVAALVAAGLVNKEIADQLALSEGTVKIHLHNIYEKLGLTNRTALATLASAYVDQLRTGLGKGGGPAGTRGT